MYQFQEPKEEIEDDEAMDDSNQESEANDSSHSPFKRPSDAQSIDGRPSDAQSIDGSSKGGRERHLSHTSMESEAESSIGNSNYGIFLRYSHIVLAKRNVTSTVL